MIILVDSQGSSTHTLFHQLASLSRDVRIVDFDIKTDELQKMEPSAIVISSGPGGRNSTEKIVDIVRDFAGTTPVLGIGTGLHAIAQAFSGSLVKEENVVHGKQAEIIHDGRTIFEGIPSPMLAGRYDSLIVNEDTLPADLMISAHTRDGEIMALRSRTGIVEGVQFHSESILTPRGDALIANFLELSEVV